MERTFTILAFIFLTTGTFAQSKKVDSSLLAIQEITKSISTYPNDPVYPLIRGRMYSAKEQYLSAIVDFNIAIELAKKDKDAWGKSDTSVYNQIKRSREDPNVTIYILRSAAYLGCKDYETALKDISYVINTDSTYNYTSLAIRAEVYQAQKRYKDALADHNHRVMLDTTNLYPVFDRAEFNLESKSYVAAIKDYNKLLPVDPTNYILWSHRGFCYKESGNFVNALKDYNQILKSLPTDESTLYDRADAYIRLKDYPSAIKDYDRVIANKPANHYAYCVRSYAHSYIGNYAMAIRDEEMAYKILPAGTYLMNQILQHINNQEYAIAAKLARTYVVKDMQSWYENTPSLAFTQGYIWAGVKYLPLKKYKEALPFLLNAMQEYAREREYSEGRERVTNDNAYAQIVNKTGWIYEQLGNNLKALDYYNQAEIINPANQKFTLSINRLKQKMKMATYTDRVGPMILMNRLESGDNGHGGSKGMMHITGFAKDLSGVVRVELDGFAVDSLDQENGYFSSMIPQTSRQITLIAKDKNGNQTRKLISLATLRTLPEKIIKPTFHAILIACSDYRPSSGFDSLPSTTKQSAQLAKLLETKYGFEKQHIHNLYNLNRKDLLLQISSLLTGLNRNDRVLILYAGHGAITDNISCWVPIDSQGVGDYVTPWILKQYLNTSDAGQVLILSDACFSDLMVQNFRTTFGKQTNSLNKSWLIITSGQGTVNDDSMFMPAVIKALEDNTDRVLPITTLFNQVYYNMKKFGVQEKKLPLISRLKGEDVSGNTFTMLKSIP